MTPTLSICIPTLNRPELLLQSLNSILCESSMLDQLEICISNNGSDADYTAVEQLLDAHAGRCSIKYVRHAKRLPLDENHHCVKRLATADYIYFLGDDDFFLRDELPRLLELIGNTQPDLAIFNGLQIDDHNTYLGPHFSLPPRVYTSVEQAFRDLRDKGSFGSVLVRTDLLMDADFVRLYGTDHAYGCFWLSLFRMSDREEIPKILVPTFPGVALRAGKKTYNHIDVYFNKIPRWMAVHQELLQGSGFCSLIDEYASLTQRASSSLRFLVHLHNSSYDLDAIGRISPEFNRKHRYRVRLARFLATAIARSKLRKIFRNRIGKSESISQIYSTELVEYRLSVARLDLNEDTTRMSK
jgi:glycosyltransferase involved in cell wall biosynthesis